MLAVDNAMIGPSLHKDRYCFACPLLFRITE